MVAKLLHETPVVPLVQADDPEVALKTVAALQAGGLNLIEVVLRTDAAMDCMEAIAKRAPGAHVDDNVVRMRDGLGAGSSRSFSILPFSHAIL